MALFGRKSGLTRTGAAALTAAIVASSVISFPMAASAATEIDRAAGADRIETAIALYQKGQGWGDTVVLARSDSFADAVAAAPLAAAKKAPVLLTKGKELDPRVAAILPKFKKAIILGGEMALSKAVADKVSAAGLSVERLAGATRYDTSAQVAMATVKATGKARASVFLATGENYPDALAAGAAAAQVSGVVLLFNEMQISKEIVDLINQAERLVAVGGPAITAANRAALKAEPIKGANRYETAAILAEGMFPGAKGMVLATGRDFPDALAGGAYAAMNNMPVLLTEPGSVPAQTIKYAKEAENLTKLMVVGGEKAVSAAVADQVYQAIPQKESAETQAQVTYVERPNGQNVVRPENVQQTILSYDATSGRMVVNPNMLAVPVEVGGIISATSTPTYPDGLLRKVLSVATDGNGNKILQTRQASIPEAIGPTPGRVEVTNEQEDLKVELRPGVNEVQAVPANPTDPNPDQAATTDPGAQSGDVELAPQAPAAGTEEATEAAPEAATEEAAEATEAAQPGVAGGEGGEVAATAPATATVADENPYGENATTMAAHSPFAGTTKYTGNLYGRTQKDINKETSFGFDKTWRSDLQLGGQEGDDWQVTGYGEVHIKADITLGFHGTVILDVKWAWIFPVLQEFSVYGGPHARADLLAEASAQIDAKYQKTLVTLNHNLTFTILGVPVIITSKTELRFGAFAHFDAKVVALKMKPTASLTVGFKLKNWKFEPVLEKEAHLNDEGSLRAQANANVRAEFIFENTLKLYGLVGMANGLGLYADAWINRLFNPDRECGVALGVHPRSAIEVGLSLGELTGVSWLNFINFKKQWTLYDKYHELYRSANLCPVQDWELTTKAPEGYGPKDNPLDPGVDHPFAHEEVDLLDDGTGTVVFGDGVTPVNHEVAGATSGSSSSPATSSGEGASGSGSGSNANSPAPAAGANANSPAPAAGANPPAPVTGTATAEGNSSATTPALPPAPTTSGSASGSATTPALPPAPTTSGSASGAGTPATGAAATPVVDLNQPSSPVDVNATTSAPSAPKANPGDVADLKDQNNAAAVLGGSTTGSTPSSQTGSTATAPAGQVYPSGWTNGKNQVDTQGLSEKVLNVKQGGWFVAQYEITWEEAEVHNGFTIWTDRTWEGNWKNWALNSTQQVKMGPTARNLKIKVRYATGWIFSWWKDITPITVSEVPASSNLDIWGTTFRAGMDYKA